MLKFPVWLKTQHSVMTQKQTTLKVIPVQPLLAIYAILLHMFSFYNLHMLTCCEPGVAPHVFMPESEASSFFIHRNRRSSEYYAELQGTRFISLYLFTLSVKMRVIRCCMCN